MNECVFIYRAYHIVSQGGLQFYLSEIGRQLVTSRCLKSHPGSTVNHQLYEGDETPLIIAIVSPLMKRVHKEIPQ